MAKTVVRGVAPPVTRIQRVDLIVMEVVLYRNKYYNTSVASNRYELDCVFILLAVQIKLQPPGDPLAEVAAAGGGLPHGRNPCFAFQG